MSRMLVSDALSHQTLMAACIRLHLPARKNRHYPSSLSMPRCPCPGPEQNVLLWLFFLLWFRGWPVSVLDWYFLSWERLLCSQEGCCAPEAIFPLHGNLCSFSSLTFPGHLHCCWLFRILLDMSCTTYTMHILPSVTTISPASSYLWFSHHLCKFLLNEPPALSWNLPRAHTWAAITADVTKKEPHRGLLATLNIFKTKWVVIH